jgi:uncharacterized protein YrzB (UPF0473 family)
MNKNKITLVDENGIEEEYEILFTFSSNETNKDYIVYTSHAKDADGLEQVMASIYDPTGKDKHLYPIESDKEWQIIENILDSIQAKMKTVGENK